MKKLFSLLGMILFACSFLHAEVPFRQITGHVINGDGTPFNGVIQVYLPWSPIVTVCASVDVPIEKVAGNVKTAIPVVNGVITPKNLFVTSCLKPSIAYHVVYVDAKKGPVSQDNWYIPDTADATIDVGQFATVHFQGPITLSVPGAVILNPTGNQTVTQPTGTALIVNNLTVTGNMTIPSSVYSAVILVAPSGAQSITQPGSTNLSINNLAVTAKLALPDQASITAGSGGTIIIATPFGNQEIDQPGSTTFTITGTFDETGNSNFNDASFSGAVAINGSMAINGSISFANTIFINSVAFTSGAIHMDSALTLGTASSPHVTTLPCGTMTFQGGMLVGVTGSC